LNESAILPTMIVIILIDGKCLPAGCRVNANDLMVSSDIGKWNLEHHRVHIESTLTVEGFIRTAKC
jgi:hypothetical protein